MTVNIAVGLPVANYGSPIKKLFGPDMTPIVFPLAEGCKVDSFVAYNNERQFSDKGVPVLGYMDLFQVDAQVNCGGRISTRQFGLIYNDEL